MDKTEALPRWFKDYEKQMGLLRKLILLVRILWNWGVSGYKNIQASQPILASEYAGYGIIVGRKPAR